MRHLLETRVRSKHRSTNCQLEFLASNPHKVPPEVLAKLETKDFDSRKDARTNGRVNQLAVAPCIKHTPSILKGIKRSDGENVGPPRKRRRLRQKTNPTGTGYES